MAAKLPSNLLIYDASCHYSNDRLTRVLALNLTFFKDDPRIIYVAPRESPCARQILQLETPDIRKIDTIFLVEKVQRRTFAQRLIPGLAGDSAIEYDLHVYRKSQALFRVMMKTDNVWIPHVARFAYWVVPRRLGDLVYDRMASTRYSKWGRAHCNIPPNEEIKARTWTKL